MSLEDDVHLIVVVRLLAVGLGRDEHVDAELQSGRLVDDLVAAAGGYEPFLNLPDPEGVHLPGRLPLSSGRSPRPSR